MVSLHPRLERVLLAAGLGLVLAIIVSLATEQSPSAAIKRGDFPAFYTFARLAESGEGARLYDLQRQSEVQNAEWPSLAGGVLPVAYPAYLAFFVRPLALLDVGTAQLVWGCLMVACVVGSVLILSRIIPALHGLSWQLAVAVFLFGPLFVGVLGGQLVGWSVLCYSLLIALDQRRDARNETLTGLVAGMWMVKPHYGLAVAALLLFERRWRALASWFGVTTALWGVGVYVAGSSWVADWIGFARRFAEIDLATNAYQMTGCIPALYSLMNGGGQGDAPSTGFWDTLSLVAALFVPLGLLLGSRWGRVHRPTVSVPLLSLGALLVLFAPSVNFYDLSLALVPLIALFRPTVRADLLSAGILLCASQILGIWKGSSMPGLSFAVTLGMTVLLCGAIRRTSAAAR